MPSSKYTVRLLSIAEQDLVDLLSYVAAENARAAPELLDHVEASLEALQSHPFAGRVPHNPKLTALGYQVLVIDNYLVCYKVKSTVVLVYRILHGARDILHLLSE